MKKESTEQRRRVWAVRLKTNHVETRVEGNGINQMRDANGYNEDNIRKVERSGKNLSLC